MALPSIDLYLSFILISIGLILLPGPNVLLVISTSLAHGSLRGLQTIAGSMLAMALQLALAVLLTHSLAVHLSEVFTWIQWLGAAWLLWLGQAQLRQAWKLRGVMGLHLPQQTSAQGCFGRGFVISLTNPKTILFFGAFLPQFVSPDGAAGAQLLSLSLTFLLLAMLFDSGYALAAGKAGQWLESRIHAAWMQATAGVLYLLTAALLLLMRRGTGDAS